ncbi:MAG: sialate O-acetylesterase [Chitinophagaceae bacterium]
MLKRILQLFTACIFCQIVTNAQLQLPAFFSDNMVLQQSDKVNIWGNDQPKTKITVKASWGAKASAETDENGKWITKIQTPAAGGPYTVQIKGSNEIIINNILIGEVWLCSGQSNMEMPVKGYNNQPIIGSNEFILNSTNNQIRCINTARAMSKTPLTDIKGTWKSASPATTGDFSATAYFFAKKLQSILKVPIGLIQTAWGGSNVETWIDSATLATHKKVIIPEKLNFNDANKTHTALYNGMLHPYVGYTIKGMIWYQGEGNRETANEYQKLFTSLITSWRNQWQQGNFPFYFVQIAPFEPGKTNSAFLREAQLKTMESVQNTGMVVTLDIGEQTNIHPAQKETVGSRLAYWALAKDYQITEIAYCGPVFKSLEKTKDNKLNVLFDYCLMGLNSFGKPLTNFEVSGEDKIFYPAQAIFTKDKKNSVTVWSDSVANPVHVRYAFSSWVQASLFNTQGLPASSFRTDN